MRPFDATTLPLEGIRLVEASAGTGKTHAITTLVVRLVVERGLEIDRILVVTFTEAATAELRSRIRSRLRTALAIARGDKADDPELGPMLRAAGIVARSRLALALANIDRASVFTIHGFCHRALLDSAFDSGARFDVELLPDTQALRDEALYDFWSNRLSSAPPEVVGSLRAQKMRPSSCRSLVERVVRAPDVPLLPVGLEDAPPPDDSDVNRAFVRAAEVWERGRIETMLLESAALNRSRYRADSVSRWCEESDAFFAREPAFAVRPLPERFEKLTASVLRASVKKSHLGREPRHPFFDAAEQLHEEARAYDEAAKRFAYGFKQELAAFVREELPVRKDRLGVMGFDDLLISMQRALAVSGGRLSAILRSRFPVALVDEFQDTDPTQWSIFSTIYGDAGGDILLIGDPKQAIYAFRGADVFAYMAAAQRVSDEARYTMRVCWRSDPGVVDAIGRLYQRLPNPFALDAIRYIEVSARPGASDELTRATPFEILFVPRGKDKRITGDALARLPRAVAAHLAAFLRSGATIEGRPVAAGDVAVLTRTNRQAFEMQHALDELGLHSVVLGDQSVFEDEQPEARELSLVLAAIVEPTDSQALRAALTTELLGVTATELAAMDAEADDDAWDGWVDRFRELNALWQTRGFVQMFRALLRQTRMVERLVGLVRGERRVTNLLHLMELLQTAASTQHLGPRALLAWLHASRKPEAAKTRPEATQIRLESDSHAIRITTVHRAKGLEYPVVYCPHLWDGRLLMGGDKEALEFHDEGGLKIDLSAADEHVERAEHERFAESLRLLYVALTRAKHRVVAVWGALGASWETSPMGYLLHAPPLAGASVTVADVKSHLSSLSDARLQADLERLAGDHLAVSTLALDRIGVGEPASTEPPPRLRARSLPAGHDVLRWWRTASFSQLVASRSESHSLDAAEGRDRDGEAVVEASDIDRAPGEPITLVTVPRGAQAGDFFHDVLEHLDFTDESQLAPLVEQRLRAHGIDVAHAPDVVRGLGEVLATPLFGGRRPVRLRDLDRAHRLDELEFYFPVANPAVRTVPHGSQLALSFGGDRASAIGKVTAEKLAEPFAHHPSDALDKSYAERVARLAFLPLEGFLKGYIDLVFERHGRWYVVDYKSNHLGDDLDDYRQPQLQAAMSNGHYYLQGHLYAVAVHRYLARRLPGYRYDRHFGGIAYLFLRGMRPGSRDEQGRSTGVFFEKPPARRIEELSNVLDLPPRSGS